MVGFAGVDEAKLGTQVLEDDIVDLTELHAADAALQGKTAAIEGAGSSPGSR